MDPDGCALAADNLRAIIKEIFDTEVKPVLMRIYEDDRAMLIESENRISKTNDIVDKLADACKSVEKAYTSHVGSLQSSRDTSQKANVELIKTCERLSMRLEKIDDSNRRRIRELNNRIAALLTECKEAKEEYKELQRPEASSSREIQWK